MKDIFLGKAGKARRAECKAAEVNYAQNSTAAGWETLLKEYILLAEFYGRHGRKLSAVRIYKKALALFDCNNVPDCTYPNLRERIYRGLGDCYLAYSPKTAREYYERILPLYPDSTVLSDLRAVKTAYTSIAVTYRKEKNTDREIYWRVRSQELQERIAEQKEDVNDPYWLIYITNVVANLYDRKGDRENAVRYSRKLIEYVRTMLIPTAVGAVLEEYAMACYRVGLYAGCGDSLKKAQELFDVLCKHSSKRKKAVYGERLAEIGKILADNTQ